jgi:hypothetical protein
VPSLWSRLPLIASTRAVAHPPDVLTRASIASAWAQVSIRHEGDAWAARTLASGDMLAEAISAEMRASLVTITAAAFSLDAWSSTVGALGRGVADERNDHLRIIRTLALSCGLDSRTVTRWTGMLPNKIFRLRHWAVHPPTRQTEPLAHPSQQTRTTFEAATFTVEAASGAVDAMLEVLEVSAALGIRALPETESAQASPDLRVALEGMTKALVPLRDLRAALPKGDA